MNFKAPRDPNTQPDVLKLRDLPESENWPCHVGSGECKESAVEVHDDGAGGEFLICRKHLPEFYAFAKLVAEMTPKQIKNLDDAIAKHE